MKLYNVLDMTGNQIQNFLVENGSVSGQNPLTAQTGRLAYNIGDRSLYFGYDNSTNGNSGDIRWSRLVDAAHIGDYIGQYAILKEEDVVDTKANYDKSGMVEIAFLRSTGSAKFYAAIREVTDYSWGLMSPKMLQDLSHISYMEFDIQALQKDVMNKYNWDAAYGWGNHADAGYTKVYKIDKAVEADGRPVYGNTYNDLLDLQQSTGKNDWVQHEVVFDTATLSLLCEYTRLEGDDTVSAYVKAWNGFNTINDAYFYEVNGNLLFVKGNASVYKYENSRWVLYLSGASQDVIQKIDAIKNALGIGDDYQDPTPDIIDTWNEMKAYFANIDDKDQSLLNLIASKANDADVIKKPATGQADDVLTRNLDGTAKWATRKIVEKWTPSSSTSKVINITSLGTTDVSVKLYIDNGIPGAIESWEEFIADVTIQYSASNKQYAAKINLGEKIDKQVKAVIIA